MVRRTLWGEERGAAHRRRRRRLRGRRRWRRAPDPRSARRAAPLRRTRGLRARAGSACGGGTSAHLCGDAAARDGATRRRCSRCRRTRRPASRPQTQAQRPPLPVARKQCATCQRGGTRNHGTPRLPAACRSAGPGSRRPCAPARPSKRGLGGARQFGRTRSCRSLNRAPLPSPCESGVSGAMRGVVLVALAAVAVRAACLARPLRAGSCFWALSPAGSRRCVPLRASRAARPLHVGVTGVGAVLAAPQRRFLGPAGARLRVCAPRFARRSRPARRPPRPAGSPRR